MLAMRFATLSLVALWMVADGTNVFAFAPCKALHSTSTGRLAIMKSVGPLRSQSAAAAPRQHSTICFATMESDEEAFSSSSSMSSTFSASSSNDSNVAHHLTDDELCTVKDLVSGVDNVMNDNHDNDANDTALQEALVQALPTMHPSLIMKLRNAAEQVHPAVETKQQADAVTVSRVARALASVLDSKLAGGKQVLAELLKAGEIRKLDASIGKFARQGQLDMAFFTVLNMNMQDAATAAVDDDDGSGEDDKANRRQILQHIYTRCQEEVEKTVPGGVALLNKLLRTEIASIRANQLEHYLCPQPNVITTPDGKELVLERGTKPVLVPPTEFREALAGAVKQIRTVEKAGGTSAESAADLVESCRQVASDARLAIAKHYGVDSKELKDFEDGLMPVFRPESPDSPYIQGE